MSIAQWPSIVQRTAHQLYITRSLNPFLNLSIEHYLLTKSPAHSKILFLYYNRPCVVIGRNQNPWLEVNFRALNHGASLATGVQRLAEGSDQEVEFLRRRSGGGTVYHDEGNLNYCAICPSDVFTRDQHAEMVTRAIREFNPRARVNERHDIVLDQGEGGKEGGLLDDMHRSGYETNDIQKPPLKMSGSAFKIVKGRGLHHGTCLLDCERLGSLSKYLHSPARGAISALGVESVRSPVGNAFDGLQQDHLVDRQRLHRGVQRMLFEGFQQLWKINPDALQPLNSTLQGAEETPETSQFTSSNSPDDWSVGVLGKDVEKVEEIEAGMTELKSLEWRFNQTPRFTVNGRSKSEQVEMATPLIGGKTRIKKIPQVLLEAKHGKIQTVDIHFRKSGKNNNEKVPQKFSDLLMGQAIMDIKSFKKLFSDGFKSLEKQRSTAMSIGTWLDIVFGKADPRLPKPPKVRQQVETERPLTQDVMKDLLLAKARELRDQDKKKSKIPITRSTAAKQKGKSAGTFISKHAALDKRKLSSSITRSEEAAATTAERARKSQGPPDQLNSKIKFQRLDRSVGPYITTSPDSLIHRGRASRRDATANTSAYPADGHEQPLVRYQTARGTYVAVDETPAGRAEKIGEVFEAATGRDANSEQASEDEKQAKANHLEYRWLDDLVQDIKATTRSEVDAKANQKSKP